MRLVIQNDMLHQQIYITKSYFLVYHIFLYLIIYFSAPMADHVLTSQLYP